MISISLLMRVKWKKEIYYVLLFSLQWSSVLLIFRLANGVCRRSDDSDVQWITEASAHQSVSLSFCEHLDGNLRTIGYDHLSHIPVSLRPCRQVRFSSFSL